MVVTVKPKPKHYNLMFVHVGSSSYASSTSRDSAMSLQNIPESDSDLDELVR